MYTLSTFTTSWNLPEPYLSPVPDQRLKHYLAAIPLKEGIAPNSSTITLGDVPREFDELMIGEKMDKQVMLRLGDEIITYRVAKRTGQAVILENCTRGFFATRAATHMAGENLYLMRYVPAPYYKSFFPGTEEMNAEVARTIANTARNCGLGNLVLDGLEDAAMAGHDVYSINTFAKTIFDQCNKDDVTYITSSLTQYNWHIVSDESWGEYDKEKGFRGTMLDGRLLSQVQLRRNLMPNKMGQYYPNNTTTVEDINWLMGVATGYDAGVDLDMNSFRLDDFEAMKALDRLLPVLKGWHDLRRRNVLTEDQKLLLRQTDCIFALRPNAAGALAPVFVKHWRSDHFEAAPSTAAPATVAGSRRGSVTPCKVDFSWTHNPGICIRSCLTDDLNHTGGLEPSEFEVAFPWNMNDRQLSFILRLPADAPCAIRNPQLVFNYGGEFRVSLPVVLNPGESIAVPHQIPVAYVYNANRRVIKEVPFADMPRIYGGPQKLRVKVTCEPLVQSAHPQLAVNVSFMGTLIPKK